MDEYYLARSEHSRKMKYIDFKINGRLFPTWILKNFKKYKLPEIIRGGEDPCVVVKETREKGAKLQLKAYQEFIGTYLDYKSPYRDILIYHGLGSGKTASAINVYNMLYNYTPGWNVFILLKASLRGGWLEELKTWLRKDEYEYRYKNIIFIHYDSPRADRDFLNAIKNVDSSKKSLYFIDEVHNFIRNVHGNISSNKGKRAQIIYDYMIQDKKENPDTRVAVISATPAINTPFEMALLFNLLRPGIFPRSENEFNHLFVTDAAYQTLNQHNKNLFQRRIMGLVTFYIGATPDVYARKIIQYVDVPMSEYQQEIYTYYEEIEEKIEMRARMSGRIGSQMYKSYTRQACNFVFPTIDQRVNGENRPRPSKFRVTEREALRTTEGKGLKADKGTETYTNVSQYAAAMRQYTLAFDNYLTNKDNEDKKMRYTIIDDLKKFSEKYKNDFWKYNNAEKKKSNLYTAMFISSAKMLNIIFNIMSSPGPVLCYSNYVLMEGLEIFKIYLKYFGFYAFMKDKRIRKGQVGYVEFHGGIKDQAERYLGMKEFNKSENKYGELLKIILISPAGSEGLSLRNVRQVHIMEPYWNEVRITQMIGRAVRQCSHDDLPMEDRKVNIYRYKSVRSKGDKWTTDQYIEDKARSKAGLIESFTNAVKEVAIDCILYKNHNMLEEEYKCFKFEEPTLFDKHVGPSYKEDIYDDMKYDNGSNSTRALSLKIKVLKIKAVKLLSNPEEEGPAQYSKPDYYWYYQKSGVVYDYDLHYPIGKVGFTDENIPMKLDKDTYIIIYTIPIPEITN